MTRKARAERLEKSILQGLESLDEFIEGSYWTELGYGSFREWWSAKVVSHNILDLIQLRSYARIAAVREYEKPDGNDRVPTARETAKAFGVNHRTIFADRRKIISGEDSPPAPPLSKLARVRPQAIELASQGKSYREIGKAVGLDRAHIQRDPEIRAARHDADPMANGSIAHTDRTVACRLESVDSILSDLEHWLGRLLSRVYTLSPRDQRRLGKLLAKYTAELESYGNE